MPKLPYLPLKTSLEYHYHVNEYFIERIFEIIEKQVTFHHFLPWI